MYCRGSNMLCPASKTKQKIRAYMVTWFLVCCSFIFRQIYLEDFLAYSASCYCCLNLDALKCPSLSADFGPFIFPVASSASISPKTGASLNPVPENPAPTTRPGRPGWESRMGFSSGVNCLEKFTTTYFVKRPEGNSV